MAPWAFAHFPNRSDESVFQKRRDDSRDSTLQDRILVAPLLRQRKGGVSQDQYPEDDRIEVEVTGRRTVAVRDGAKRHAKSLLPYCSLHERRRSVFLSRKAIACHPRAYGNSRTPGFDSQNRQCLSRMIFESHLEELLIDLLLQYMYCPSSFESHMYTMRCFDLSKGLSPLQRQSQMWNIYLSDCMPKFGAEDRTTRYSPRLHNDNWYLDSTPILGKSVERRADKVGWNRLHVGLKGRQPRLSGFWSK